MGVIALAEVGDDKQNQVNELLDLNETRKKLVEEALNRIDLNVMAYSKERSIFVIDNQIPLGIVGIVAGKISEYTGKPAFVLTKDTQSGFYKGSARSKSDDYGLAELLNLHGDLLVGFGGHKKAAGLTIKEENISVLKSRLEMNLPDVIFDDSIPYGKYLIATHEKNTNSVNYYAAIAMFEASNTSKEMASIIEGEAYLSHQKKELEQAVDEIRVTNETRPAYVLSLTEPEKYIKISPTYFEYFDRGNAVHKMSLAQNPELYADALKLLGNSLPKPVFKLQTEINELGGINAALIDAKKHMPNGIVAKNYPMDTALKNWILEKTSPQSGFLYQNPDYVQKLNLNDFKISYLREHPSAAEEFEKKKPHYEKQVQVFYEKIQNLYRQTAHPMMNIDDTLMRCGYDPATIQEEFYDQKEVTEINSGKYQVEINSEADEKVEEPAKETKDFTNRQKEIIAARQEQTKER